MIRYFLIQTITYDKVLKTNKMYANITESLFFVKKIRQNPRSEDILKKFHFPKKNGLSFKILSCTKYDFYGLTINIIQYKIYFSNKHVVVFFLFNNLNDI
jgi:hypothetical protein